jgi:hypothetical protein
MQQQLEQARFFEHSWDRVVSKVRGRGYRNSYGKGIGTTRYDYTLPQPAVPALPNLYFTPVYAEESAKLAGEATRMALKNDVLIHRIQQNILKATRNRYNLEVFLSLAEFTGHHNRMIFEMKRIEDSLQSAREAVQKNDSERAVGHLADAYNRAKRIQEERHSTLKYLKSVWEKSLFPKGQEFIGKKFHHVLDDTKDHWADRVELENGYRIWPLSSRGLQKGTTCPHALWRNRGLKSSSPLIPPRL